MTASIVRTMGAAEARALRARIEAAGIPLETAPHALFRARAPGVVVVAYESGKVVIQGKGASDFASEFLPVAEVEETSRPRVGSDEAGKGDYLGPLVVGAVFVDPRREAIVRTIGVADSKTLAPAQIRETAEGVRAACPHAICAISPRRYNELYESMGNLNRLLAWAHGKAIEEVLGEAGVDAHLIIIDRFADDRVIAAALGAKARAIERIVRPRAEDDPAVAAASVVARDAYDRALESLGRRFGVKLSAGAGPPAEAAARAVAAQGGIDALREVAKLHFRTTERILRGVSGR